MSLMQPFIVIAGNGCSAPQDGPKAVLNQYQQQHCRACQVRREALRRADSQMTREALSFPDHITFDIQLRKYAVEPLKKEDSSCSALPECSRRPPCQ